MFQVHKLIDNAFDFKESVLRMHGSVGTDGC